MPIIVPMRACPYCGSRIPDVAVACRFCGRAVTPLSEARRERQGEGATMLIRVAALALLAVLVLTAALYLYRSQSPGY